jgi:MFS family permease
MIPPLLRVRDVRLLWAGETVTALGTAVSSVAMPLVALEVLDAGVLAVTLLTAAAWLPWLVIGLPAGAWVDRLPKRPMLVTCDAASALLLLSVPVAAWGGWLTVAHLVGVALGLGVASVFFRTAWTAYVPAVVPPGGAGARQRAAARRRVGRARRGAGTRRAAGGGGRCGRHAAAGRGVLRPVDPVPAPHTGR